MADASSSSEATNRARVVLLVDDSPLVRGFIKDLLVEASYEVLEADDVAGALKIAGQPEQAIDLLMSDLLLPGLNGVELAKRIRITRPGLKVLLLSADPANEAAARLIPDARFLDKNQLVDVLTERVAGMLAG